MPVDELRPWDENPRTISHERLENLRRALAADPDFLRLRPILARSDGTLPRAYIAADFLGIPTLAINDTGRFASDTHRARDTRGAVRD
ncbi:MAG: hypothetical protein ACRDGT_10000 [Candidatus Limnocylindria bacterium]